jgi:hypothetical protein
MMKFNCVADPNGGLNERWLNRPSMMREKIQRPAYHTGVTEVRLTLRLLYNRQCAAADS